ncbi:MAG: transcriptional regulator [Nitrospinota bacterium]|nr:transcriptional regulator [Nitrospinota bacterium]
MTDFDYQKINELIHSRIRLAIMSVLINLEEADFTFLKQKVNTTDGNLSIHLSKLENAGYISVNKIFEDKKPRSLYRITKKGRDDFEAYIEHLEEIIKAGSIEES